MVKKSVDNYVIWGTGIDATKLYYQINKKYNISFFIDNKNEITDTFLGKRVFKFLDVKDVISKYIILIAAPRAYNTIKNQCIESGLTEFIDFFPGQKLTRKMAVLHGNCHMDIVKEFLESSVEFNKLYFIYDIPRICHNNFNDIPKEILNNCDVYIHQDIRRENPYGYKLSDEYLKQYIQNDCIDITVPNLFGAGKMFFPQFYWNNENMSLNAGADANGLFPHGDMIIDKAIESGMTDDQIVGRMDEDVIASSIIRENFEKECAKLQKREQNWDIKCLDFIIKNYKQHKLFYDQGHPTNFLMKYIVEKILEILSIEDHNIYSNEKMDEHEEFVYKCVRRELDIVWQDEYIRCSRYARKLLDDMDRKEYVKEYIWWKKQYRLDANEKDMQG